MKYISIDLETTGLDPINNQILEFGAVFEDTDAKLDISDLPKFQVYIDNGDLIHGNMFALQMNANILKRIATKEEGFEYIQANDLGDRFAHWLVENGFEFDKHGKIHITVAGKNFGTFDLNFLNNCEYFNDVIKIRHRIIDPSILCVDWKEDETLPGLPKCKDRMGLSDIVTHNAVEDAIDVIEVMRNFY